MSGRPAVAIGILMAVCSCGGSAALSGADMAKTGSGAFSCNFAKQASRYCTDQTWSGDFTEADAQNACTSFGGTKVTMCDRTGAVGGCRTTQSSASGTLISTTWFYDGTVDTIRAGCAPINGVFVSP
jgi:hypothetical protein